MGITTSTILSGRSMNMEGKYKLVWLQGWAHGNARSCEVHKAEVETDHHKQYLMESEDDSFPMRCSAWNMGTRIQFPKQHKSKLVTVRQFQY